MPKPAARRVLALAAATAIGATVAAGGAAGASTGEVLLTESFSSSSGPMSVVSGGAWRAASGKYALTNPAQRTTPGNGNIALHAAHVTGDFTLSTTGTATSTASAWNEFGVVFGYRDAANYYYASFNESNDNGTNGLFRVSSGKPAQIADIGSTIKPGSSYRVRVERADETIRVFRNDVLVASATSSTSTSGRVGFGTRRSASSYDDLQVQAVANTNPAPAPTAPAPTPPGHSAYDGAVLNDRPAAFWSGTTDLTGNGNTGIAVGGPQTTRMPNGDSALVFDGRTQYLEFRDSPSFSIPRTGQLSVEYWMRPDTLQFATDESSGYVKVLGKGAPNQWEWYGRMYSKVNAENRPNRISGYVFNPAGGLGAGSYFQDAVSPGDWIHVTLVFNTRDRSTKYPTGYTKIYKNGVLRDQDALADYSIVPADGTQPLRIGSVDRNSFFAGAIGKVAVYDRELPAANVLGHYQRMGTP